MDTAQPKFNSHLGAHVRGIVKSVQVTESRRLRQQRVESFKRNHGNMDAFRNLHGMQFNGCFSHFMTLSLTTRAVIERDLERDIKAHPELWMRDMADVVEVVEDRPERPNLFLSQGKDYILGGTTVPPRSSSYCVVGTGTSTPAASDIGLGGEVVRTANYLTGSGNCGTTNPSTGVYTFRRTYDFPVGTVSQNYSELAFSHSGSPGNNISSRVLISGGTVTVTVGQSLRVVYDLTFTANASSGSTIFSMDEWGSVSASYGACYLEFGNVQTNGLPNEGGAITSPSRGNIIAFPVSGNFSFALGVSKVTGATELASGIRSTWETYTNGTFTRAAKFAPSTFWDAASFSSTAIRGFIYKDDFGYVGFAIKFSAAQTKTNLQRLFPNGLTLGYTS